MAMIKDDGTPWSGPGFEWSGPTDSGKGNWPAESARKPVSPVDDINTAIQSSLRRADNEMLLEDGTGEYILAGGNEE